MNSLLSRSVMRVLRGAALSAAFLSLPVMAQTVAETRAALEKAMPGLPASAKIIKTPYAGLYEVDIGTKIFYTDAKATFLFAGEIFDTKTQTNVTKARIDELRRVNWKDLPFKDSFKLVFGNGKRQIAIFEDPYCPYCHQMEATLEKMSNVTLHVFVVPIIRRESLPQARDIWCAPNRSKAWLDWMNNQVQPPKAAASCVDPLKANVDLANKLGISSTPTMFFTDGSRMEGAVPQEEVEKKLASIK
ncbi:DsbC family protein [Thiomonas intermedia]|uniref:DsbC family protein n=1 Tax=Thiomonas intermedia TaxID=926 RepID=UPI0009A48334|nr:DsbC family protein [Thiomonas intermedia]